jgi:hypothetical protein
VKLWKKPPQFRNRARGRSLVPPITSHSAFASHLSYGRVFLRFSAWTVGVICVLYGLPPESVAQNAVNHYAQALEDFDRRVNAYVDLHHAADRELPRLKPTDSPAAILDHQRLLADKLRQKRTQESQGSIFSPEISQEFRRLVAIAMQGSNASHIHKSLKRAEPVRLTLRVNDSYPADVPLQSMPPTLLQNLPHVPPEVDYRIVDHALVLRDMTANLIVDFIPDAIP